MQDDALAACRQRAYDRVGGLIRHIAEEVLAALEPKPAQEQLQAELTNTKASVRRAAILQLGREFQPAPVDIIAAALSDPSLEVRLAAASRLRDLRQSVPLDFVLSWPEQVGQENADDAWIEILEKLHDWRELFDRAPLAPVLAWLSDDHEHARRVAVSLLRRFRLRAPLEPLIAILGEHPADQRREFVHSVLRAEVIQALSYLREQGAPVLLDIFEQALCDPNELVRVSAALALLQHGVPVAPKWFVHALLSTDYDVRQVACKGLAQIGQEAVAPVVALLQATEDINGRTRVLEGLAALGSLVPDQLWRDIVQDTDPPVRQKALSLLNNTESTDLLRLVVEALTDSDDAVRNAAVATLLHHQEVVPIARFIPELTSDMRYDEFSVRASALRAARSLPAEAVDEMLIAAVEESLGDTVQDVQEEAVETLALLSPSRLQAVGQEACAIVGGGTPGPVFGPPLTWWTIYEICKETEPTAAMRDYVLGALNSTHWQVRQVAVRWIGQQPNLPSPLVIQRLHALAYDARYPAVQRTAEQVLAHYLHYSREELANIIVQRAAQQILAHYDLRPS